MAIRTKYIGVGATATAVTLIVWFFLSSIFSVEVSGDVICDGTFEDPCEAFYNITSLTHTYYIYNKDKVKLNFIPDVKDSYSCKKDGRYNAAWRADRSLAPCGIGWREFNWDVPLTKRFSYIEKFIKNKKHEYKLVVFKYNPSDRIKWGGKITGEEIDPVFLPGDIDITVLHRCKTTTKVKVVDNWVQCKKDIEYVYIVNVTVGENLISRDETRVREQDSYCLLGKHKEYLNTTICEDTGFEIDGRILYYRNAGWMCERTDYIITCDAPHQSNKDGICQSGERCAIFDIKDLSKRTDTGYSPTKQIEELKIE